MNIKEQIANIKITRSHNPKSESRNSRQTRMLEYRMLTDYSLLRGTEPKMFINSVAS